MPRPGPWPAPRGNLGRRRRAGAYTQNTMGAYLPRWEGQLWSANGRAAPCARAAPSHKGREAYDEKNAASAGRQGRRRAGSTFTCACAGTWSHLTVYPAPWLQKTESGVLGRSASGS